MPSNHPAESAIARTARPDGRTPIGGSLALGAVGAVIAVAFGAAPASAQQLDTGRLTIEVDGRRVGTESFRVWREQATVDAFALVTRENGSGPRSLDVRFRSDASMRPVQYRLRAEGQALSIDGEWTGDRLRLHVNSEQGERWKEIATPGGAAVLEDGVAHHYLLLAHRLREAQIGGRLAVIVPSRTASGEAVLRARQSEAVQVGARSVAATRFDIEIEGRMRRVWIDSEGRLLRVEDPGSRLVATRLPDQG